MRLSLGRCRKRSKGECPPSPTCPAIASKARKHWRCGTLATSQSWAQNQPPHSRKPNEYAGSAKFLLRADLSVPLSEEFPVSWPGLPPFRKRVLNWFENYREPNGEEVRSLGHFYDQSLELDEHTGTHMDFPAHILVPQALAEYDKAFAQGSLLRTFAGPAIVLDATADLDRAPAGISPRVSVDTALAWERQNGSIESGDIVLINTGYMDHYFAAFPQGSVWCTKRSNRKVFPAGQFLRMSAFACSVSGEYGTWALRRRAWGRWMMPSAHISRAWHRGLHLPRGLSTSTKCRREVDFMSAFR